jgi:putative toxin-antitoxin system antitoxin component (TIGR02293 family)
MSVATRTGEILGLKSASVNSLIDLSGLIARGFSVSALDRLVDLISPSDKSFRYRIVSKATLARRAKIADGRLSQEESGRLDRLLRLWAQAEEVWKDEPATRRFLNEPHPMLKGQSPIDLALQSDAGARAAEQVLGRLAYGSAA